MALATDPVNILQRVLVPDGMSMSTELARYLAGLNFSTSDHDRFQELSDKSTEGTLTLEEANELDGYLHIDRVLGVLRLRAQRELTVSRCA